MNKTLIDISNLHLSYNRGKSFILRDISFSLWEGEVLSIIGKNGTGKSSLLKSIVWIEKVHSWTINRNTKKISYVPQKLYMENDFPLQVHEFIKIFNEGISQDKIEKYFSMFQINKLLKRNIHSLSGWEFQKVLILNALLSEPELLLLDEPTSGIDMIGEELFYKTISEIKELFPTTSIILVSHNLNLVYKNSNRVICLHENNFCCHGTPSEIQNNSDVQKIFWEYVRPYEHQPHIHHHHTH